MYKQYSFDEILDRRNTNCAKWDTMDKIYGRNDLIHLGVADMDFKTPPAISEAFMRCAEHGIYGYTDPNDGFYEGIIRWFDCKNNVAVKREEIVFCPRISISVSLAVEVYTDPGDEIIIHTPSYDALYEGIVKNKRNPLESPLIEDNGYFRIDFEKLEDMVTPKTKMYILCSPFNPVGRVFTKEELDRIGDFCIQHDLILYVDEIHGDIVADKTKFITALSLKEEVRRRLIVASSLSKTFNIPGVIVSYMMIPDKGLRNLITADIDRLGMHNPNIFSVVAVEEGLKHCDDWYEEMLMYINSNESYVRDYFGKHFPQFHIYPREGTFLLWISYEGLGCTEESLKTWFIEKARVEVYMGTKFGQAGRGYFRLNIGSPRALLEEAFERMRCVYDMLL